MTVSFGNGARVIGVGCVFSWLLLCLSAPFCIMLHVYIIKIKNTKKKGKESRYYKG